MQPTAALLPLSPVALCPHRPYHHPYTGLAVWGKLFNDIFQYRADVMEGRKAVSGDTAPCSNFRYSVRGHVSLLDPVNGYGYKGMVEKPTTTSEGRI